METNEKISILFVDDEQFVLDGLRRMLINQKKNWDMHFVLSGKDAIEYANKNKIDVVVTDMRMPIMSGAELLDYFYKNFPYTIRIILSGHSDHELIIKTVQTSHQFLSKPFDADELVNVINNSLKSRDYLNSQELQSMVNGIDKLPTPPAIYLEIENELQSNEVSILKIEKIISNDISLTAKILQVANSSYFSSAVRTADIKMALNILGVNVVKSLVLFLHLQEHYKNTKVDNQYFEALLNHSKMTAEISKIFCEEAKSSEFVLREIYSTAILHDIGKLILFKNDRYAKMVNRLKRIPTHEEEIELFGFSHAHIGAYLLRLWNLPPITYEAISNHHERQELNHNSASSILYYSDIIANNKLDDELLSNEKNQILTKIKTRLSK
jgi:putative nucleotidyltransferase with HDIG domain